MTITEKDLDRIHKQIEKLTENATKNGQILYHTMIELDRLNKLIDILKDSIDKSNDRLNQIAVCVSKFNGEMKSFYTTKNQQCLQNNIIPLREDMSSIKTRVLLYGGIAALGVTLVLNTLIKFIGPLLSQ